MIGGEGPANPTWMQYGTWLTYADKLGALCLMLEHRFYGKSHPTPYVWSFCELSLLHLGSQRESVAMWSETWFDMWVDITSLVTVCAYSFASTRWQPTQRCWLCTDSLFKFPPLSFQGPQHRELAFPQQSPGAGWPGSLPHYYGKDHGADKQQVGGIWWLVLRFSGCLVQAEVSTPGAYRHRDKCTCKSHC